MSVDQKSGFGGGVRLLPGERLNLPDRIDRLARGIDTMEARIDKVQASVDRFERQLEVLTTPPPPAVNVMRRMQIDLLRTVRILRKSCPAATGYQTQRELTQ